MHDVIGRRTFLSTSIAALAAARVMHADAAPAQLVVPNSAGTEPAALKAPPGSCDCHHHIYDAQAFPPVSPQSRMQVNASVKEYKMLQRRLGLTDAELKLLDDGGVRGIRFSVADTTIANTRVDMIEPLAKRIAPLGWHI